MAGAWVDTITTRLEELDERTQRIENKLDALLALFKVPVGAAVVSSTTPATQTTTRSAPNPEPSLHMSPETFTSLGRKALSTSHTITQAQANQKSAPQEDPYIYEALNAAKSEIRLLALHPSSKDADSIVCELRKVELEQEQGQITARSADRFKSLTPKAVLDRLGPRHQALSYTWGSSDKTGCIILNGHRFPVTKNLEAALRQLRQIDANTVPRTRWWIDAICINQEDVLERNSQVSLMRRIYKRAKGVSIWLGEEADDSSFALDTVMKIMNPPKKGPGEATSQPSTLSANEKLRCWKALWALYQRPWFERVWVRQEIALTKFPTLYCGASSCHLHTLIGATTQLDYVYNQMGYRPLPPIKSALSDPPYAKLSSLSDLHKELHGGSKYAHLKDLLTQTRSCQASDLRDKIYSVLGMTDPDVYHLQPDYRTSHTEVFISATRCIIEASKRLDILSFCQSSEPGKLPSWVPNYAEPWQRRPFNIKTNLGYHKPSELDAGFSFEGKTLRLNGDFIDSIKHICQHHVHADDIDDEDQLNTLLARWKNFVKTQEKLIADHFGVEHRYLIELSDQRSEGSWLSFLSIGESTGGGFSYSPEGKLLPPEPRPVHYDVKHLRNLLVPDEFTEEQKPLARLYECLKRYGIGRRLCLSDSGVIGLVPAAAKVGDKLIILHGASFPYVLRSRGGDFYSLVGEACALELCFFWALSC